MLTDLFVISGLHLGGEPGDAGLPGFQMCPAPNQERLAGFIAGLPRPSAGGRVQLVIAGDIVDFLAEREFLPFNDERIARDKFKIIADRTRPIWNELGRFVKEGGDLTLMLGNHDIELSLPAVRRDLIELIGSQHIGFVYDNEAFSLGPVLIEHGNRYDGWNAVPHHDLRRVRSLLSRRLPAGSFVTMPGSELVAKVMNPLKADYSWIDLLKPEDAGVLPILAALGAPGLKDVWNTYKSYRRQAEVEYGPGQEPVDPTYIAAAADDRSPEPADAELYRLAQNIAAGGDAQAIGAMDVLRGARAAVGEAVRAARRKALLVGLRAFAKHHARTFDLGVESEIYLNPAKAAAERGFEVVIYGHTHLAKHVGFTTGQGKSAVYLNSGTWADLIRLPDAVFAADSEAAATTLEGFVADLEKDDVKRWRKMAPTFAHVRLDDDRVVSADVCFADRGGAEPATTAGLLARLGA